eukprot:jgi/Astpho2/5698/fgenesh1_pg.00079_%23_105_t
MQHCLQIAVLPLVPGIASWLSSCCAADNMWNKRLPSWQNPPSRQQIRAAFDIFDVDRSGTLDHREFEDFARHFLKAGPDAFFARLGRATVVQAGVLPASSVAIKHLLAANPAISPVPHVVLAPLLGLVFKGLSALLSKIGRQLGDDFADLKTNFLGKPRSPRIKAQGPSFDPMLHELQCLPMSFDGNILEEVAEARTGVLEVVSEMLSRHVLRNYDKFVAGVNEISAIEGELQAAWQGAKDARAQLGKVAADAQVNIQVARQTRRKHAFTAIMELLNKLHQAAQLRTSLREAQENGEYARAFWLCSECCANMEEVAMLKVAQPLEVAVRRLFEDTVQRLEHALHAVCSDFNGDRYGKVLEGYLFLGRVSELGGGITMCFTDAVNTMVLQVVRGIMMTRPGFEDRAKGSANLQEILKWLPSDLFRTCLARVLMVIFDIMASHFHMSRWHNVALEQHKADLADLANLRQLCKLRMTEQPPKQQLGLDGKPLAGVLKSSLSTGPNGAAMDASKADPRTKAAKVKLAGHLEGQLAPSLPAGSAAAAVRKRVSISVPEGATRPTQVRVAKRSWEATQEAAADADAEGASPGKSVSFQSPHFHPSASHHHEQQTVWEELQGLEAAELEELEWGDALQAVRQGLAGSRRFLWDESARKIGILLSMPSAFEGEHFLEVLSWSERMVAAGEAFSGTECAALRSMLTRQSSAFFAAYHDSNLEGLQSMLEKELWRRLSLPPDARPSLAQSLHSPEFSKTAAASSFGQNDAAFAQFAAGENPWKQKRRRSPKKDKGRQPFRLGLQQPACEGAVGARRFAGATVLDEDRASRRLEVDEHGLPRRVSNDVWSNATSRAASRRTTNDSDVTAGGRSMFSESDMSDVYGDWIDEETQTVVKGADGGDLPEGTALSASTDSTVTNSSIKLLKWLRDYGELLRMLQPAAYVYRGICEMFEMYLLETFNTFSDVSIADLVHEAAPQGYGGDAVSNRLRSTLLRIVNKSLQRYRALFVGSRPPTHAWERLVAAGTTVADSSPVKLLRGAVGASFTSAGPSPLAAPVGLPGLHPLVMPAQATAVSNSGKQALMAVAAELKLARGDMQSLLPVEEHAALEVFFNRTVEAAEDVCDSILRSGARLNLPVLPALEHIAGQKWELAQLPGKASPWVDEMCMHAQIFRERLSHVKGLSHANVQQLWRHAIHYMAEVTLEGVARIRTRCSAIGRHALSNDVREVFKAVQALVPPEDSGIANAIASNSSLVDNYLQAFFVNSPSELQRWVQCHPEYRSDHLTALATQIADFKGLKKKDRQVLLELIEGSIT